MQYINTEIIPEYKFNHDFTIEEICIGTNVKEIHQCAFFRCINLSKFIFEKTSKVKYLGTNLFYNCLSLTEIDIPDSVSNIEEECFHRCYNLQKVKLPSSISSLKSLTFDHCRRLESIIIPENVKNIEYEAFSNCHQLKKVFMSKYTYENNSKNFEFIFTSCHEDLKVFIN